MRGRGRAWGMSGGMSTPGPMMNMMGGFSADSSHITFDITECASAFPRVTPPLDDTELTELLMKRNLDLSPTDKETSLLEGLIKKTSKAFDTVMANTEQLPGMELGEVQNVGAYRKKTMMKGQNVADVVVIFKSLPTKENVNQLADKIFDLIKAEDPNGGITKTVTAAGFLINAPKNAAVIRILLATQPVNVPKLEADKHVDSKMIVGHLAAVRHAIWFEESADSDTIRAMVRILTNLKHRYVGLAPLTAWMIDLLAHHCVMKPQDGVRHVPNVSIPKSTEPKKEEQPSEQVKENGGGDLVVPKVQAKGSADTVPSIDQRNDELLLADSFRRALKLLASGIFLPGSVGIMDPCEPQNVRCHMALSNENQDMICYTGQTLLRVLSHGGCKQILGYAGNASIATEMSVWDGVVVTASEPAYEPPSTDEKPEGMET